ncbi:hypothetical protein AAG570_004339 [Ranatra chinensis]|uniref:Uncharacterized protein n=1 Tax=Ranatra chinensis TaxID=642074 RepID=A0ABD0Y0M9_9HEMI
MGKRYRAVELQAESQILNESNPSIPNSLHYPRILPIYPSLKPTNLKDVGPVISSWSSIITSYIYHHRRVLLNSAAPLFIKGRPPQKDRRVMEPHRSRRLPGKVADGPERSLGSLGPDSREVFSQENTNGKAATLPTVNLDILSANPVRVSGRFLRGSDGWSSTLKLPPDFSEGFRSLLAVGGQWKWKIKEPENKRKRQWWRSTPAGVHSMPGVGRKKKKSQRKPTGRPAGKNCTAPFTAKYTIFSANIIYLNKKITSGYYVNVKINLPWSVVFHSELVDPYWFRRIATYNAVCAL